jgi:MYXO-CTERM domain-containing protein
VKVRLRPVVGLLALLAAPARGRADGAFPDSMRILLPPDQPGQLILGTNFGLVVSNDGGARWSLVCEEAIATAGENVTQYSLGPPPGNVLYAVSSNQLAVSSDAGCTWSAAAGGWTDPFFTDLFPDPADAGHVFVLALVPTPERWSASSLYESRNAGRSFAAPPLYQAVQGLLLTGVESAASAPHTLYLTAYGKPAGELQSLLARSDDGATFHQVSLLPSLGTGEPRLAAVHPRDARVVYYRVVDPAGDKLAISRDGGETARVALALSSEMSTFLRREDGTLLVGSKTEGAFRSADDGDTFVPWPEAPRLRALGERAGVLYAVGDDLVDRFAVGASEDGGKSWRPLLRFEDICGILECPSPLRAACQSAWFRLVALLGIRGACGANAPEPALDAAAGATATPPGARGCACASAGAGGGDPSAALVLLAAIAVVARRRRKPVSACAIIAPSCRRRRPSSCSPTAPAPPRHRPGCADGPAVSVPSARS